MTLTPEQLEEARQLLGISEQSTETAEVPAADTAESTESQASSDTPVESTPAAVTDNTLSVYCPNCSHLLAKVSNDAN